MIAPRTKIFAHEIDDPHLLSVLWRQFEVVPTQSADNLAELVLKHKPAALLAQIRDNASAGRLTQLFKRHYLLDSVPIIVFTGQDRIEERIEALNGGIDEFIVCPCNEEEMLARVNRVIHRNEKALSTNALTRLPGNISIQEHLQSCISRQIPFAAYWVDIDHFKSFNDLYGYAAGDTVIHLLAKILVETLNRAPDPAQLNFTGHIGGDDFVLLSAPEQADEICREIIRRFDASVPTLYPIEARNCGYIETQNRQGKTERFPLMTLTIAVATNLRRTIDHPAKVSEICGEIKSFLKKQPGSKFLCDRRYDMHVSSRQQQSAGPQKNGTLESTLVW